MKLVSFSVTNYRSITSAYKLPLRDITVLIGPNNEGKSNILRALVTALKVLTLLGGMRMVRHRYEMRGDFDVYEWKRDFPISMQINTLGESKFVLEFELDERELAEFKRDTKSKINAILPIEISIGCKDTKFKVLKRGKGAQSLSRKKEEIARFVSKKIQINHIPAVRTASKSRAVVEAMVEQELRSIEANTAYKDALEQVKNQQQPLLDKISQQIQDTLREFLPNVRGVKVSISEEARYRAFRTCSIEIDDGTPTELSFKGDGVQSLSALGLMRYGTSVVNDGRELILAIEEPESHLHPAAIHQLKKVILEIATNHQVIMTSHCPLFVDRKNVSANILVHKKKAKPARSIDEIREMLGVRVGDNLRHAEVVLLVEGESDKVSLSALLKEKSSLLRDALDSGRLAINPLRGVCNLAFNVGQIKDCMCDFHAFLDCDRQARVQVDKAVNDHLIEHADVTFATCLGLSESEMEDLYNVEIYKDHVETKYGVRLDRTRKSLKKKKWSERMKGTFQDQGKSCWDDIEKSLKNEIANKVSSNPENSLNKHLYNAFTALVDVLEVKLEDRRDD